MFTFDSYKIGLGGKFNKLFLVEIFKFLVIIV